MVAPDRSPSRVVTLGTLSSWLFHSSHLLRTMARMVKGRVAHLKLSPYNRCPIPLPGSFDYKQSCTKCTLAPKKKLPFYSISPQDQENTAPPEFTNMSPKKTHYFNRKYIWTNHWFSRDIGSFSGKYGQFVHPNTSNTSELRSLTLQATPDSVKQTNKQTNKETKKPKRSAPLPN